jgi:dTDP-glucose 4,6-dehydratase
MNLKDNKILITGADGFIGSHLTEALVEAGYDVRAFVYYNSFNSYGWLDTVSKEIKNKNILLMVHSQNNVNAFIAVPIASQ